MTAGEVLHVIRRDIGQQFQMALQFKISNHLAADTRIIRTAITEVEAWFDVLVNTQLTQTTTGNQEYWMHRADLSEAKLTAIQKVLNSDTSV